MIGNVVELFVELLEGEEMSSVEMSGHTEEMWWVEEMPGVKRNARGYFTTIIGTTAALEGVSLNRTYMLTW